MGHPLESFERIFVINLTSRRDRRREMSQQLRRIGLELGQGAVELFDAVRPDYAGEFSSIGSRGCYLSHLGVLRRALSLDLRSILVLEDDLDFIDAFPAAMAHASERLATEPWAMFYGGGRMDAPPRRSPARGCVALDPDEGVGTTHFYALRGPIIADLANYLELLLARPAGHPDGGPMHVDGAYCWFRRRHPEYLTLLASPELGYQRLSRTDVHDLRWYDRSLGVRHLMSLVRRVRRTMEASRSGSRA
ncbi:MAG TPA: glycosyltransferase family 25 protein [Caldimonas sp.]|nr:glycosyltransferase family 25 protein [Caldimonas sp.]